MSRSKKYRKSRRAINSIKRRKTIKRRKMVKRRKTKNAHNKYIGGDGDEIDLDKGYDNAMIKELAHEPICIIRPPNKPNMVKIEPPQLLPQKQVGGGGTKIDWVMDFTDKMVEQFQLANGFSDAQLISLSVFNPSVTWLMDSGNASYYCCATRCIYYTGYGGAPVTPDFVSRSYFDMFDRMHFYGYNNYPDASDRYVKYPGSMFNKWISTGGFWRYPIGSVKKEVTMITIIKRDVHSFNYVKSWMLNGFINGHISSGPVDARVLNIFNPVTLDHSVINTVYITGQRNDNGTCANPVALSVEPTSEAKRSTIIDPVAPVGRWNGPRLVPDTGRKQTLTRAQVLKHDNEDVFALAFPYQPQDTATRDPFTNTEISTESSLANCISWAVIKPTEKNYALFYFHHADPARTFCPGKCMILNYVMASKPTNRSTTGGLVFYYKPFDASASNGGNIDSILDGAQFETAEDKSWRTVQPPNSDIFTKVEEHFNRISRCRLRVSCTTPFVEKDGSLIAVGHIKMDVFSYLNDRIEQAIPLFGTNYNKIKDYYKGKTVDGQRPIPKDHLFNYGLSLIKWANENILNDMEHGINGDKKYIVNVKQTENVDRHVTYSFLSASGYIKDFLTSQNFIKPITSRGPSGDTKTSYQAIRNLHPTTVYFMFFYKINKNTLALESFSHPFMILQDATTSFLNFPMGLTSNQVKNASGQDVGEKHYWLSYGEGDCQCKLAAFKSSQLDALVSQNNNDKRVTDIEFWSYKAGDIS